MRKRRFVVGLTGGIGTGKSAALGEFERLGAAALSLDQIAHQQARPGREGYRAVLRAFGRAVLDRRGRLDRRALGELVFRDAAARRRLERAVHPPILREMARILARVKGLAVVDVPLLFEKGLQRRFDVTVLVACGPAVQLRRVVKRDGLPAAAARRRIRAQWPLSRKRKLADFTLDNGGTPAQLRARVRSLFEVLTHLSGGR